MWFGEVNGTIFTQEIMEPRWAAVSPEGGVFWLWIQSSLQDIIIHSIMGTRMILGGKHYTATWFWYFFWLLSLQTWKSKVPYIRAHALIWICIPCLPTKLLQSCQTLCNPINCSPPGSSAHGFLQARILQGVAMPSSRGSSQPRDQIHVSYVSCIDRRVLYY